MKKVRFSTKRLHISAFLPIFTQNLRMSDYGNKHSVQGTGHEVNPKSWTQPLLFICEEEH